MTEEELQAVRQHGKVSAQKTKDHYGEFDDNLHQCLLSQAESRDRMHRLAKQGNEEAERQEAFLKGFLSQWD